MDKIEKKTLIESIDQLGDRLGELKELSKSLYNKIEKDFPMFIVISDIYATYCLIEDAEKRYTNFHKYFFNLDEIKNQTIKVEKEY